MYNTLQALWYDRKVKSALKARGKPERGPLRACKVALTFLDHVAYGSRGETTTRDGIE